MSTSDLITSENFHMVRERVDAGLVKATRHPSLPLTIYNYAERVQYDNLCYYGICDCIDNTGSPYPSQWGADIVARAKESVEVDERLKRFAS